MNEQPNGPNPGFSTGEPHDGLPVHPDASTPDSPPTDAAEVPTAEAPTSDAPTPDAPTPDAPTPDAPTPDAPTPNAPTPDAPTPDAPAIPDEPGRPPYWTPPARPEFAQPGFVGQAPPASFAPGYPADYPPSFPAQNADYRRDDPTFPPPTFPSGSPSGSPSSSPAGPPSAYPPALYGGYPPPGPSFGPTTGEPDAPGPATRSRTGRTVLVAAITAAVIGGGIGAGTVAAFDHNDKSSAGITVTTQNAPTAAKVDGSISAAAAKIQPSVVTINVTGAQEAGTGSGVIIDKTGYILTNNHVVAIEQGGGTISVVTDDGQQASATVVGTDPSDDLAVIKVSGLKNLTAATFGKSSQLIVGQTVVAVGAPLGLSDTVTSGIISNVGRPVTTGDSQDSQAVFNAVQTDAAINPGNSGGALADLNGNVVGINAAIATANSGGLQIPGQSAQSGSIGIGFAIPADEASRIASELISTGKATHAVIGVTVQDTSNGASGGQQPTTTGAPIQTVDAGGAAAAAGLKAGDVVTMVGSQRIADATGLIAAVRSHAPGETVSITYVRAGATKTASVKLGTATG